MYYIEYICGVMLSGFYNLQYSFRFGKYKKTRIDEKTLFIHIPKTGGSALATTLGINTPGHFSIKERESAGGTADKIVVTVRDPIDRFISIWKYSRKINLTKFNSPLFMLQRYGSIDQFIKSGLFAAYTKHHYFFRTQKSYLRGYNSERHELVVLNQETLANDVKQKLNYEIEVVNKSPQIKIELSEDGKQYLQELYSSDYEFLFEINGLEKT